MRIKQYRNRKGRFAKRRTTRKGDVMIVGGILATVLWLVAYDLVQAALEPVVYVKQPVEEVVEKEVIVEVKIEWTPERIKKEVWEAAAKYNTFPEKMWQTMLCENDTLEPTRQSHHTYTFTDTNRGIYKGEREKSFGLVQIHLPDHDVTYEEAVDPQFAIDFMAKHFAEGKASWWTCYKMIYR